jgi:mono/diheme cytochrome c family protein/cytochrome c556
MKKIIILATAGILLTANAYACDNTPAEGKKLLTANASACDNTLAEGKKLLQENCLSCHGADLDPPLAPPMFGVQKRYKMDSADRAEFIRKITEFVQQPSQEKALMKRAIKHVGLMPEVDVAEDDLQKIVTYIHDASFAIPCNHLKAAMKMAKEKGDAQHFNHAQSRFKKMCAGNNGAKVKSAAKQQAGAKMLKQIMQKLGSDYSRLNHAILLEDFDGAAQAAHAIAYHDKPPMSQRMKILGSLGTDMPKFKQADGKVHALAIKIEEAAKAGDMPLLMQRQSQMLSACMACHSTYRSRVVDLLK